MIKVTCCLFYAYISLCTDITLGKWAPSLDNAPKETPIMTSQSITNLLSLRFLNMATINKEHQIIYSSQLVFTKGKGLSTNSQVICIERMAGQGHFKF